MGPLPRQIEEHLSEISTSLINSSLRTVQRLAQLVLDPHHHYRGISARGMRWSVSSTRRLLGGGEPAGSSSWHCTFVRIYALCD